MTIHTPDTDRRDRRLTLGVVTFKCVFALALLRVYATPASEEFLPKDSLPWPTWEWSLCALTPGMLIWLARSPQDWKALKSERSFLGHVLVFYFLYALVFAVSLGIRVLWIAVVAAFLARLALGYLNRRERRSAR